MKVNISVLIRNVVDCRVPLPPDIYGQNPKPEGMMNIINPADWFALEQALNIKGQNSAHRVMVYSLGPESAEESLRWCLAAGADQALRIWDSALADADQLGRGKVLATALMKGKPDLVLGGDGCLDQMNELLPGVVAANANMVFVPGVTKVEKVENGTAVLVRKMEKGRRERVEVNLPVLVAIEDGGGTPAYYADLPNVISAFSQPVPSKGLTCLGVPADKVGSWGARVNDIMTRVTIPSITRPVTPDPNLSAEQRLRKILAGGVVRKQGEIITGTPEQMVDRIIEFLRQEPVVMI